MKHAPTSVLINVIPQGDVFVATSRDVPGLHIWADTEEDLRGRVVIAIRALVKANYGIDVSIKPDPDDPADALHIPHKYRVERSYRAQ
jgi:hypothetical protein